MEATDLKKASEILLKQEEMLQFDHFTGQDVWDLGKLMVEEMYRQNIDMTINIRQLNGRVLFHYAAEKTALINQKWMDRKFNTVSLMERSSLAVTVTSKITGEVVETHGLDEKDYVFCGGGFPVRIKDGRIVAVVLVSNLPHVQDHAYMVGCLAKYLGINGVPELDMEI
jgi:uncharacterized protein (UPF0303 family)